MIKGGFQGLDISGVDLTAQSPTLPGAYAACAAADGKTVLVLTAAGAVQCSVKKVSTNYVLAGITGDGKILSITIGSTDGISVSENVVPSAETTGFGSGADIASYTSSTDPYIVPSDGYITLKYGITVETAGSTKLCGRIPGGGSVVMTSLKTEGQEQVTQGIFVRKGMPVYVTVTATAADCRFYPLQ